MLKVAQTIATLLRERFPILVEGGVAEQRRAREGLQHLSHGFWSFLLSFGFRSATSSRNVPRTSPLLDI